MELEEDCNHQIFKKFFPWIGLLQDTLCWHHYQDEVESAAILSAIIADGGYYSQLNCKSSDSQNEVYYTLRLLESRNEIIKNYDCKIRNPEQLVHQFINMIDSGDYFRSINKVLFKEIASLSSRLISSYYSQCLNNNHRGDLKDSGSNQMMALVDNLNYNLYKIRRSKDINDLINHRNKGKITLESYYCYLVNHYRMEVIEKCPQIGLLMVSVPFCEMHDSNVKGSFKQIFEIKNVKAQKADRLRTIMKQKRNWKFMEAYDIDKLEYEEMVVIFQDVLKDKKAGRSTRRKIKKLLKYLSDDDCKFKRSFSHINQQNNFRKQIKQVTYQLENDGKTVQIETQTDTAFAFFQMLKYILGKIPTDIQVQNMSVLRSPYNHILYEFFKERSEKVEMNSSEDISTQLANLQDKMQNIYSMIKKAKESGMYNSDWQNNFAKIWNSLRTQITILLKKQAYAEKKQEKEIEIEIDQDKQIEKQLVKDFDRVVNINRQIMVPPPLQFLLSMDMYPQAYAFSFTNQRKIGYCINYDDCLQYYVNYTNYNEKQYFYWLLQNPPKELDFLNEIPKDLMNLECTRDQQLEYDEIEKLDNWLEQNPESITYEKAKKYTSEHLVNSYPKFIQDKIKKLKNPKWVSTISLFHTVSHHFPAEDAFNNKLDLPFTMKQILPKKQEPQKRQVRGEIKKKIKEVPIPAFKWKWAPLKYGGLYQTQKKIKCFRVRRA